MNMSRRRAKLTDFFSFFLLLSIFNLAFKWEAVSFWHACTKDQIQARANKQTKLNKKGLSAI